MKKIVENGRAKGHFDYPLDSKAEHTLYINKSSIYCLIFGSKKAEAITFKRCVCKDVVPSIRKTGSYMTEDNEQKATRIVNHPRGERALHYDVVDHIKRTYPEVILPSSLGENQKNPSS